MIRSPDGNTWVEFPSGAVDKPTVISFASINPGESYPDYLARFALLPVDWHTSVSVPANRLRDTEDYQAWVAQPMTAPVLIYHRYEPDYVDWPETLTFALFDEEQEDWLSCPVTVNTDKVTAVGFDIDRWGNYIIAKNFALGGRVRPWPWSE